METPAHLVQTIWRSLILLFLLAAPGSGQRVFLFSFDGLGQQILDKDEVALELRTLWKLRKRGVMAAGVQAAFPSSTANSHCALFHGAYGDVTHCTGNRPLLTPRSQHEFTERGNGYLAGPATPEPIWVTAARQGVPVIAHNVTQALPFSARNTHPQAIVVNGYQSRAVTAHTLVREGDVLQEDASRWVNPPRSGGLPARAIRWQTGALTLHALLLSHGNTYDRMLVSLDPGSEARVEVRLIPAESAPPLRRPLARHFSEALPVEQPVRGGLFFRLFELDANGEKFLLYQSPLQELAVSEGETAELQAIPTVGNGASSLHSRGLLGEGELGDRRYLETVELCARQLARQFIWLLGHRQARLAISYLPFPDEFDHTWIALARRGDPQAAAMRRWGYQVIERFMRDVDRGGKQDSTIFLSDHGMAEVDKAIAINAVLEKAGLGGLAAHHYNSVIVNTTDWRGGKVAPQDKAGIVERARGALAAVRDPRTPSPLIHTFLSPEEDKGRFGIGGPAAADLYFDLAPGYQAADLRDGPVVRDLPRARGVHGFLPTREDMLATLVASGPRFTKGGKLPRLRSTQVVPLVCDLLGILPPDHARETSPLAISSQSR